MSDQPLQPVANAVQPPSLDAAAAQRLADNIIHFARALRAAGLPVGTGAALDATRAIEVVGLEDREAFYWALRAIMVSRPEHQAVFDQAFHLFWRNPALLRHTLTMQIPATDEPEVDEAGNPVTPDAVNRRVAEAMSTPLSEQSPPQHRRRVEPDIQPSFSALEQLRRRDFDDMTAAELTAAKDAITRLRLPLASIPTRRWKPKANGRNVDLRRTLIAAAKRGGDLSVLRHRDRRHRPPPLIILCDISGSMHRYSRMVLHFIHALTNDRDRVHSFLFGTRLTNITRWLKHRDVDVALARVSGAVEDWSGGTRIGASLRDFNRLWSRRVLTQGGVVLLITDGLERETTILLAEEMARLHRSCRRLIWLNPLLRYEAFAPKSLGAQAMMPHVDEFRPVHSLNSLAALASALSGPAPRRLEAARIWMPSGAA